MWVVCRIWDVVMALGNILWYKLYVQYYLYTILLKKQAAGYMFHFQIISIKSYFFFLFSILVSKFLSSSTIVHSFPEIRDMFAPKSNKH